MTRDPCPVCGGRLQAWAEVIETRWIEAFSCGECGRFTADGEVLALLERAEPAERRAISMLLALRCEDQPQGVALRRVDLPERLQAATRW